MTKVSLIWDFDGPIGNINATYPYNFSKDKILDEFDQVKFILDIAAKENFKFVFAVTGFTAEEGFFPYNNPQIIRDIYDCGHEIASHSWKHEWFPFLNREQILRSLKRSKEILESCIGKPGCVQGFVLPHSRPMTWKRRLAFSRGDRSAPGSPASDIQSLLPLIKEAGFNWTRLQFKTLWQRVIRNPSYIRQATINSNVLCLPQHCVGFLPVTMSTIEKAIRQNKDVVVIAHPGGLSRSREENVEHFKKFIEYLSRGIQEERFTLKTVQDGYMF